jgi:hypothetical protein
MDKPSCRQRLTARAPEDILLLTRTAMGWDIDAVHAPTASVVVMGAVMWEGPIGHDAGPPVRPHNPHEIALWGRS